MFKLDTEFYKLPLLFDAKKLAEEVLQFTEAEWRAHPQGHAGNTALPLISVGGGLNDDVKGPMQATEYLARCPYIQQVLASLGTVFGRARLMRIAGNADATEHVDTNYYWMHHVRVHIPAVTYPQVQFMCNQNFIHMEAGTTWIFDSWKRHNVLNPVDAPRIHLVADTVGSSHFWNLIARSERPFDPSASKPEPAKMINFEPGKTPALAYEEENFPLVMSPWEQESLAKRMLDGVSEADRTTSNYKMLLRGLGQLHQEWHALWTRFGNPAEGIAAFRDVITQFDSHLNNLAGSIILFNEVPLFEALRQAIVRPATSPEIAELRGLRQGAILAKPPAPPPATAAPATPQIEKPVFIVAAPRSGSSMLFELLSRARNAWTIGGESHLVFESIPSLNPANRGFDSNRLTVDDATPEVVAALKEKFISQLQDREGNPLPANATAVRLLEKTPKNALRISFLAKAFPDARFIYLYREPQENISSILDAWKSQRFVTYPKLPDWTGENKWSLLLVPGWRELNGKPPAEIATQQWLKTNGQLLDELAAIPADRVCAISYAEILQSPQAAAERLCAFAGLEWDVALNEPLPLSSHTLTPPAPEKWRKNEAELAPFLPLTKSVVERAAERLSKNAPRPVPAGVVADSKPELPVNFESEHTNSLPKLLEGIGSSLLISTYQAGKLIIARSKNGELNTHFRDFFSPMGMAYQNGSLAIGTKNELWKFHNHQSAAPVVEPAGTHDAAFLPSMRYSTGDIRIHEIAWVENEVWAVNTKFSCLCTFDGIHSFVPRWKPPFISKLEAEDRCHLNGFAIVEGVPAYVTCLAVSDEKEGWRNDKIKGGCIIEVQSGEIIASGLCMPHSPRFYDGRLWFLNSGHGHLSTLDLDTGKIEVIAELPGFTRGLDFYGPYAFVGLSQVRESNVFSGLPICEEGRERQCGVWVVDIRDGKTVGFLRFSGSVQEIFAVQVLPGIKFPELINEDCDLLNGAYLLPEDLLQPQASAVSQEVAAAV